MSTLDTARWGEREAARYLQRLDWEILETNWHCRYGEIDIVARHGEALIFVEVKARRSRSFGTPEEAMTPSKTRRLLRSAWTYLEAKGLQDSAWRVDVVAIEGRPGSAPARLDHYPDAVSHDPDGLA
jgi:putative endonuclease